MFLLRLEAPHSLEHGSARIHGIALSRDSRESCLAQTAKPRERIS